VKKRLTTQDVQMAQSIIERHMSALGSELDDCDLPFFVLTCAATPITDGVRAGDTFIVDVTDLQPSFEPKTWAKQLPVAQRVQAGDLFDLHEADLADAVAEVDG
jgi:hypothetical protein